jgi:hypothetical protein
MTPKKIFAALLAGQTVTYTVRPQVKVLPLR